MTIILNGQNSQTNANTLAQMLAELDLTDAIIATAVNGQFVQAARRAEVQLSPGDAIEIVAPMQGG